MTTTETMATETSQLDIRRELVQHRARLLAVRDANGQRRRVQIEAAEAAVRAAQTRYHELREAAARVQRATITESANDDHPLAVIDRKLVDSAPDALHVTLEMLTQRAAALRREAPAEVRTRARLTGDVLVRSTAPAIAEALEVVRTASIACRALMLQALSPGELEQALAEVWRPVDQAIAAIAEDAA